ncbi:MAG TPA: SpoIIE family protein phosphatase [Candidatus Ozemobacteraceae bacterium]
MNNHYSGIAIRRATALFLFAAALVLIPFGAAWHLLVVLEREEASLTRRTASEELQEVTAHLARLAHPETACSELADRLSRTLTWNGDLRPLLEAWPAETVRLYLFDPAGRRVQRAGCVSGMQVASERVFALLLRAANEGPAPVSPLEKRQIESFLGSHMLLPQLASRADHLHDGTIFGVPKYIGWYNIKARSGGIAGHLLVFIDQRRISPTWLASRACTRISRLRGKETLFGWLEIGSSTRSMLGNGAPAPATFSQRLARLPVKPVHETRHSLLALSDTSDGIRLFGLCRAPAPSDFYASLRSLLVVVLVELMLILAWWAIFARSLVIPLRLQLLGWFGLAAIAGLASLIGFARVYGEASQATLIRNTREAAVRLLQKTDGNFGPSFAPLTRRYRQTARGLEGAGDPAGPFATGLGPIAANREFAAAFYISATGGILSRLVATPGTTTGNFAGEQPQFIRDLACQIMNRFNSTTETPGSPKTGSQNMLTALLSRPVEQLVRQRGTLQPMTLNGVNATVFLELICDAASQATASLLILHDTSALEASYLSRTADSLAHNTRHRLLALPKRAMSQLPAVPQRGLLREPDLDRLLELLDLTESVQHRLGRIGGERMLITAVPGQAMSDYHLFLMTPFQPIDDQVRAVSARITLLAVAATGFSLVLAWMFAGHLLGPMRTLTAGIDRLSALQLDEPVTVETGDELQQIGDGVTEIMDDLQERALAKTVQEQLIQGKPLTGPGWHLQGWSRTASDIGGEIFDMLELPDGRVAFMAGDVAARGVSAALVMTMAKTAVRLFLDEPDPTPTVVLTELDRHFRLHARRLSRVGMFLAIFTPSDRTLRYVATGRLFPVLLSGKAVPRLLTVDGDGLGAGSSGRACPEHRFVLEEGDRLVVCTDGVIDSRDPAGRPAGPDGICDLLEGLRTEAPGQLGNRLWEALDSWQGGRPPEDDQTVLALTKIPDEASGKGEHA